MISNSAPERKDVSVPFLSNRQLRVLVFCFVFLPAIYLCVKAFTLVSKYLF